ncbi:MAG TPA: long-chain fatty acid--CoA ligase [Ktedonobacterales bacterium]|nr:long-chain fatty acid--CoA ligase [Ktedonobacterales bacterium]
MVTKHFAYWPKRVPHSLTIPETTLCYNLDVSATRYPNKTAIVYYGRKITYRELAAEVGRLAGYLERSGVKRGDRVLLLMQNSPQFIIGFYAILRANAVVVPLNSMLVTSELRYYAQDSQAELVLVGQDVYPQVAPLLREGMVRRAVVAAYSDYRGEPPGGLGFPVPEVVTAEREAREAIAEPGVTLWADALAAGTAIGEPGPLLVGPDDLAVLPYTSGTTGNPKGCMHSHRTVMANVVGGVTWNQASSERVVLAALPLFHVTGMQGSMNAPIYRGACVVLMTRWNRDAAAELIQRERVTGWGNISTMMIDFLANPRIEEYDLSSLEGIGGGGAPLPAAVGERLLAMTGLHYVEGYGLSETMAQTHANPSDRPKMQCLGIPVFDVDAQVVEPTTLEELGPNRDGEILVSGPQLFLGYWNKPDETAQAFVELEGKRFLRTGDLGHYDEEGYFFHTDRLKRMINASGYKVWPAEVETLLYRHPAVQEACVIASPDERRGETVKALVVLRESHRSTTTPEEIMAWARGEMAAYKCPRSVEIVEGLPKSASGKVLWRVLQEQEREGMTRALGAQTQAGAGE